MDPNSSSNTTVTGRTVKIHGHEYAYRSAGDGGPVVLLIHGMAGSAATWNAAMPLLAPHMTVVAPDLPGHGRSHKARGDYSLGALASFLRDFLTALGHDRVTVVGQSLGGGVAMQFCYQYPERVERLVLVGSGGLGEDVMPILKVLAAPGVDLLLPPVFLPILRDAGNAVGNLLARVGLRPSPQAFEMWRAYSSLVDPATRSAFVHTLRAVIDTKGQRISAHDKLYLSARIPSMVVWGDHDPVIPVQHAYAAHEAMPASRLEIFEGCGHFPHVEDPARFAEVLVDFVRTTEPAAVTAEDLRLMLATPAA
ncbi:MAG: alpha/beta fold hydrolase [Acidimicrobiales bacterium]